MDYKIYLFEVAAAGTKQVRILADQDNVAWASIAAYVQRIPYRIHSITFIDKVDADTPEKLFTVTQS